MADKKKQLVLVVEGTAALGPYWRTILSDYLEELIRSFCGDEAMNAANPNVELALVIFNTHGSYSSCLVQRSSWTTHVDFFFEWLSDMHFSGGGFCDAAIAEGLAEVLTMLSSSNGSQTQQNEESLQRHCILVAASNPYPLPTSVYRPPNKSEAQPDSHLSDAEAVAKSFPQSFVSLSVICPRQLPKLKAIYNAGNRNPSSADPTIDIVKNPHHLVLISENFVEACVALNPLVIAKLPSNQSPAIRDITSVSPVSEPPPTSVSPVKESLMNQQSVSVGNSPISVKVEPGTVSSMASNQASQTCSPLSTSQKMISSNDNMQDVKPVVSDLQQPMRPACPANVNILNNLSQARLMNPTALSRGKPTLISSIGGTPIPTHMSNMISGGMTSSIPVSQTVTSSGHSSITSTAGSTTLLAGTAKGAHHTGTMVTTHSVSQQVQQTSSALQSGQSRYAKIWEGALYGNRQGKDVFISKLEAYRSLTTSEKLTEDWPSKLQIDRLISQDHMNSKPCHPKGELLVFRAMNQHGFLVQLQEKKLCTVIRLPSQTLLLAVTDKSCRLIGMVFPGDKVVFNPQISRQQQQLSLTTSSSSSSSSQQQQQQKVGMETNQGTGSPTQLVGQGQGSSPGPKA